MRTMNRRKAMRVILGAMAAGATAAVAGMNGYVPSKCGTELHEKKQNPKGTCAGKMDRDMKGKCGSNCDEKMQEKMKGKCGAKMQEKREKMKGQCGTGKCSGTMKKENDE
ncbi:MAG: hypothetical protein DSY46_04090 [Hydrogenimonas sp.]|nr:MAG: hypothetical protein DSY46_04090 [Hydrogenimonas sp.]